MDNFRKVSPRHGPRQPLALHPLFSDHLVFQREARVPIWGLAKAGAQITVRLHGQQAQTRANRQGHWRMQLGPFPAGGPYVLSVTGLNQSLKIRDVMIGEVWLCSGQSNMQIDLPATQHGAREMHHADYPQIRMFAGGSRWVAYSPISAHFLPSAVAYFFARDLHRHLNVPIGLIHAAVGGSRCEAWMHPATAARYAPPPSRASLQQGAAYAREYRRYQTRLAEWERIIHTAYFDNYGLADGWAAPNFDDRAWEEKAVPHPRIQDHVKTVGSVWFRKAVMVPAPLAGHDLELQLGPICDFDHTYFNGELVGAINWTTPNCWQVPRIYRVPGRLVKSGRNVIAVRLFNKWQTGGLFGSKSEWRLARAGRNGAFSIALCGRWRYRAEQVLPFSLERPELPPLGSHYAGSLFNANIHPLMPYRIRGAIWYQGESDVPRPRLYRRLFPALIRDWRRRWRTGKFPFLFVQLPNYGSVLEQPAESAWAALREAQTAALKLPQTEMAVTVDVGDNRNIHPPNKLAVGRRLARAAEALVYGRRLEYSGPRYAGHTFEKNRIRVRFAHVDGGLMARGGPLRQVALAGRERRFIWARTRIEGNTLVAWHPKIPHPAAVRYAWADAPEGCNLYNRIGLPAAPFRTDRWPLRQLAVTHP